MPDEMFASAVRSGGDLAGVFEHDGEVGYFYLYSIGKSGNKILNNIRVAGEDADFSEGDIEVLWNPSESMVGMFISGKIWAVFDVKSSKKYGGDYKSSADSSVPSEMRFKNQKH